MQKRMPICFAALVLTIALIGMASGGLGQTAPASNASDQDHSTHHPPTVSEAPMAAPGSGTSSGTAQSSQGDMMGQDGMMSRGGMMSGGMMGRGMMGPGMMGGGMMSGGYGEDGSDQRHKGRAVIGPMMMRIIFSLMDADGDGKLSLQEFQAAHERIFKAMDANKDGFVTLEEMQNFMRGISKPASQQ